MDNQELADQIREMSARQLIRWLTTPARCGFYVSSDDIRRLAAEIGVTVQPFGRAGGLEQLLRGAALDNRLDAALSILHIEMKNQLQEYQSLDLGAVEGWIDRGQATIAAWEAISSGLHDGD